MSVRTKKKMSLDDSDQRYLPRWEVSNRVLYQFDNDNEPHEGKTKDLSCAGVRIETGEKLVLKKDIKLTIYLSADISVTVNGKVAWTKPSKDHQSEIGITFQNVPEQVQETILQHAFEINREEVVKHWFKGWDGEK